VARGIRARDGRIRQDQVDRLARLETETLRLVEVEGHGAVGHFLAALQVDGQKGHEAAPGPLGARGMRGLGVLPSRPLDAASDENVPNAPIRLCWTPRA
jgi:hypothetical protein